MIYKKKKTSNGVRHQVCLKKFLLCKKLDIKSLKSGKKNCQGRGFTLSRITVNHKGGGAKQAYRNMSVEKTMFFGILIGVTYDPKRSSFVSVYFNLLSFKFNNFVTTKNTYVGSLIFSYTAYPQISLGSLLSLRKAPTGSLVHSLFLGQKSVYIKSAGVFGIIVQKNNSFCKIKLPSGLIKQFPLTLFCVLGCLSNTEHFNIVLGKAGKSRLRGKRPVVRGVAMNPVDHPHGGQTSGGIPSVTPWAIPTKGKPTKKK